MNVKYTLKDGRSIEQELPNDEAAVAELFRLVVRGKNNNADIKTNNETVKYENVKSVALVFE